MSHELSGAAHSIPAKKPQSVNPKKRCSNSVFPAMSVAHVDDDGRDSPGGARLIEKAFPNGDIYTGEWSDDADHPHGRGKYLWSDGCMYAGEWSEGKTLGRGRFSWPSGATYEGRFKNGYMDGEGTYIGSTGDTYRGTWARNTFHGGGSRSYANGDCYNGRWRRGLPDGRGRYTWRNGDQYIGQWKQGRMHGAGAMTWAADGGQYDGSWRDGLPRGNGTFRWPDGSLYVGVWSEDHTEQRGTYYPSSSRVINGFDSNDWDPQEVYLVSLRDCRVSVGEKIPIFPSQKTTSWGLSARSNDNDSECSLELESDLSCNECSGCEREEVQGMDTVRKYRRWPRMRRQGHTILKGHKNYELMLNLQLGIRHSIGRPSPSTSLDLKGFDTRNKTWMRFPSEGSKHTPPHQSCEFKWKDYCPSVFRTLRKLFKVDPADYMISICGDDALRELSSPGKSGSFFYLTDDDKYMIKTMKKSEVRVLKRMLPSYYNHVSAFENTLVTKFFGLHCVRMTGSAQKKVRFVVMGNLFCTEYAIHRRFDLKGSSHGRITVKPETKIDSTTTLKDLDLNLTFRMHKTRFQDFRRQLDKDCEFLEQERIMDYSLLVGIHFRELSPSGEPISGNRGRTPPLSTVDLNRYRLGCNVPARAEATVPTGEYYDVVLVFGIIDILQDYDISKKLEHAYKSFQYDSSSISAVDPRQYSRRFRDFIFRVFGEDD